MEQINSFRHLVSKRKLAIFAFMPKITNLGFLIEFYYNPELGMTISASEKCCQVEFVKRLLSTKVNPLRHWARVYGLLYFKNMIRGLPLNKTEN